MLVEEAALPSSTWPFALLDGEVAMSILNLLSLEDDLIGTVTTVVRSLDSQRGRNAMDEAVRLTKAGERSDLILADKLASHMRLEQ